MKKHEGWNILWTTAPEAYDSFGTETLEHCGEWRGRPLRRIWADPRHTEYQTDRYHSGLHPSFTEDPRIKDAEVAAMLEQERVERFARAVRREAGLTWITTATDLELDDYDVIEQHGLRTEDARAEKERRRAAKEVEEQAAEWARCAALVPVGCTLIDEGYRSPHGVRPPHVWHDVKIVPGWPAGDPDRASVMGEGRDDAGSLLLVADWISKGRLRIAAPSEVIPPRRVLERFGYDELHRIIRVIIGDRTMWVGRRMFEDLMVLDDAGWIVRGSKLREAAIRQAAV